MPRKTIAQIKANMRSKLTKKSKPICCICDKSCECDFGNNPAPLAQEGRCCNECNKKVIEARIKQFRIFKTLSYKSLQNYNRL
jgi:hypothetical protein